MFSKLTELTRGAPELISGEPLPEKLQSAQSYSKRNNKQLTEEETELTAFILSSVQRGEKLRREISNFVEKVSVFAPENPDIFAETLAQIILRNSKRCLQKAQAVGGVPHSEAAAVYDEFALAFLEN